MNIVRSLLFGITLFCSVINFAQTNANIVGKWEMKDKNEHTKFFIFEDDKKLYAITYYVKEDDKVLSYEKELNKTSSENITEKDFKELESLVVLYDFNKEGSIWKGKLIYDEDGSETNAYLKYIDKNTLEIGVKNMLYSEKFNWKRID